MSNNSPIIRFSEFHNDWCNQKISDMFKITRGYVLATNLIENGNFNKMLYPVYSSQTKNKGLLGYYTDYLYEDAITWTTDGANAGTVNYRDGKFFCTNVCGVLLSNKFQANQMIAELLDSVAKGYVSYVGNPKLMNNVMSKIEIKIPMSSLEQEKISKLLKNINYLIDFQKQKMHILKKIKKAMLEKMFPKENSNIPELRFKDFTDVWEQRELGEIAEFNPKSVLPDSFEYVDLESVVGTDILYHRTEYKSSAPSRAQRLAQKGDIFYQTVRPYQKNNCIFEKPYTNWVFSTGYTQLRPMNDGYFLLTLLQNDNFVKLVLDRCTGTSYPAINSNDLADINIKTPNDNNEQKKIGHFFRTLDSLLVLHQRKLEKYKQIKQALMDKMFV